MRQTWDMDFLSDALSWLSMADQTMLQTCNAAHTGFTDLFMWYMSDRWVWTPLYLTVIMLVFRKYRTPGSFVCLLLMGLMIALTDQACASIIRPAVARLRPSNPDNPVSVTLHFVNGYRGGRFGFPSCHAANSTAFAVCSALLLRDRRFTAIITTWALLVSYSRVYLGVHYPGDILGGILAGCLAGALCYRITGMFPHVSLRRVPYVKPDILSLAAQPIPCAGRRGSSIYCLRSVVLAVIFSAAPLGVRAVETEDTCLLREKPCAMQDSTSVAACADSVTCSVEKNNPYRFRPLALAVPAALIGAGAAGTASEWFKGQNTEIRDEMQEHPHSKLGIDDFTQFAPLAALYGLRLCGVRSLHGYRDMTMIAGTAYLLTGLSVYGLKSITKIERPDGSAHNSFPSGHTATAFTGAELLRREYRGISPWIGVAGYIVAAGTGFLRMYNNRHWLTDVVAGAGIGILSVQAAYWLYAAMSRLIFGKRNKGEIVVAPASVHA